MKKNELVYVSCYMSDYIEKTGFGRNLAFNMTMSNIS